MKITNHLHPMVVHFPIALIIIGFLAQFISLATKKELCLSKVGFYLLILGATSTLVAMLSGELFTAEMSGAAGEIKELHELFAWITIITSGVTTTLHLFIQKQNSENKVLVWTALILYGIAAIAVGTTGFFGGTLVYNFMMPL